MSCFLRAAMRFPNSAVVLPIGSMAQRRAYAKLLQPHEQPRRVKWFGKNAKQRIRRAGIGITTLVIPCCKNDRHRRQMIAALAR
jgi:hypothetical protein